MVDAALQSALSGNIINLFGAIRIDMAGIGDRTTPLCLLDGAGYLVIDGEAYTGADDLFGAIDSIDEITEQDGDEAPSFTLSLNIPEASGAAALASPAMQGREVRVMVGAFDPQTGEVVGSPEVLFLGEIDVPTLKIGESGRTLELEIISTFELLFEVNDAVRAQDAWHQSVWPGEKGLAFMDATDKNLYWGGKPPSSSSTSALSSGFLSGTSTKVLFQ